jgi:glycosyltransferase involved in cell wall biosynthesis
LPPGCVFTPSFKELGFKKNRCLKILYVGGLGELYQLDKMLDTVKTFPPNQIKITVCTRADDLRAVYDAYEKYMDSPQIKWIHSGGEDLKEIYAEHDVCCLWLKPTVYWGFVMPVKLFEYLAFQKPILAVKNTAAGNFVSSKNIGWAIDYEQSLLRQTLVRLLEKGWDRISENLSQVANENRWVNRALEVEKCLIK